MKLIFTINLILVLSIAYGGAVEKTKATPKVPFLLWDINFNRDQAGQPPQPFSFAEIEAAGKDEWKMLPMRTFDSIDFVTRTRTAIVKDKAFGLDDKPVVFDMPNNHQPTWGPRMHILILHKVAQKIKRLHLSVDVAKNNVSKCGGFDLMGVVAIHYFEDGSVKARKTEVSRYRAQKPIHFDIFIDNQKKTVEIIVDGNKNKKTKLPWRKPKVPVFRHLRLDGLMPGGFAMAPGKIAFDNIKLTVLAWKKEVPMKKNK